MNCQKRAGGSKFTRGISQRAETVGITATLGKTFYVYLNKIILFIFFEDIYTYGLFKHRKGTMRFDQEFTPNNNYNLIVIANHDFSTETFGTFKIENNRFLENIYDKSTNFSTSEILKLPCLFMNEVEPENELPVYFGYVKNIQPYDKNNYIVRYNIEKQIKFSSISTRLDELDIQDTRKKNSGYITELHRTHWLIKFGDLKSTFNMNSSSRIDLGKKPQIFLSWSGQKSRQLAEAFKTLACSFLEISHTSLFISSKNIESGDDWWQEVSYALESAQIGLIFVTDTNSDSIWLNYEAGALRQSFQRNLYPISLSSEFTSIYEQNKTPLLKYQFINNIDNSESAFNLMKLIANKLNVAEVDKILSSTTPKNFKDSKEWQNFTYYITGERNSNIINFKNMLQFWVPKVKESWETGGNKGGFPINEIRPENTIALETISKITEGQDGFKKEFLKLNDQNFIAIKFKENPSLKYEHESCITWIPNKNDGSWFIKIIYSHKNQSLKLKYLNTVSSHNNDSSKIKEAMKNTSEVVYPIASLGLDDLIINNNVKNLYNNFVTLIDEVNNLTI